jgi:hypothetical protein
MIVSLHPNATPMPSSAPSWRAACGSPPSGPPIGPAPSHTSSIDPGSTAVDPATSSPPSRAYATSRSPLRRTRRIDAQGPVVTVAGLAVGAGSPVWMCRPLRGRVARSRWSHRRAGRRRSACSFSAAGRSSRAPRRTRFRARREALGWMRRAADRHGLRVVTEAMSEADVGPRRRARRPACRSARATCRTTRCSRPSAARRRPVLLKRAMSATVEEWLLAAEYLLVARRARRRLLRARHPRLRRHPQPARPRRRRAARARAPPPRRSSTPRTPPAAAISCCRSRARPSPRAPRAS